MSHRSFEYFIAFEGTVNECEPLHNHQQMHFLLSLEKFKFT